jgi:hypothetical protein
MLSKLLLMTSLSYIVYALLWLNKRKIEFKKSGRVLPVGGSEREKAVPCTGNNMPQGPFATCEGPYKGANKNSNIETEKEN